MIWLTIKKYWTLAWGLLLSVGSSLLTFLLLRSRQNKREKKMAEARADHLKNVMVTDKEIELEHDKRTEDLKDQVEKDGVSDELKEPNKW